jgi:hypothetical protein
MKKLLTTTLIFVFCIAFSQKKASTTTTNANTLATKENVILQIITETGKKKLVATITDAQKKKTNVLLKEITTKVDSELPKEGSITIYTVGGVKLYLFTYKETAIAKTTNKTETKVSTSNEVWEFGATNVKILGNIQTNTNIKEKVFLDAGKTASQDVEKNRKEGFEFTLTKTFDVILSNKTQSNTYKFNATTKRYDPKK